MMVTRLNLDLWQMEILQAVTRKGSLTAAATELGITQSAVSQAVTALEKAIGLQLLDRRLRPMQLTVAGRYFMEGAESLLSDAHALEHAMRTFVNSSDSTLRIAMVASLTDTIGPELVRALDMGQIRCAMFASLPTQTAQQFERREIDVVVSAELLKDSKDVIAIPLLSEPYLLCLPKEWGLEPKALADLKGRNFIRHTMRTSAGRQIEQAIRQRRLDFPLYFESETVNTNAAMVAAGLGWSISSPLIALQSLARLDKMQLVPLPGMSLRRKIHLYARARELGERPHRIAQLVRGLLRQKILPQVAVHMPWVLPEFTVYDRPD